MDHLWPTSVPVELYVRGVEVGVLPREPGELRPARSQWVYEGCGATVYSFAVHRLAAGNVTPEQREILEESELAYARWVRSHPVQGAEAYTQRVPHLSPGRRDEARRDAPEVLAKLSSYIYSRQSVELQVEPHLHYRECWRVLAPGTYPAWLREQCAEMLRPAFWRGTPRVFRQKLAHAHLLGEETPRGLAAALDGLALVEDGFVTPDREVAGLGGALAYTMDEVHEADRLAQGEALHAIAPILPPELHARAADVAARLRIDVPADLGTRFADPLAMRGARPYHPFEEQPIPWLTVAERRPHFAALDDGTRGDLVAALVEDCVSLAQEFLSNPARIESDPVLRRWTRLSHEDLPVVAPHLDADQTRRLLALWALPDEAVA